MSERVRFVPPGVDFDPRLANELARLEADTALVDDEVQPIIDRRSPFNFYVRMLTPEGGILISAVRTDRSHSTPSGQAHQRHHRPRTL